MASQNPSYPEGAKWVYIEKFQGLQTKSDPTKVSDGATVFGQNVSINDGDRISVKPQGYSVFPGVTTPPSATTQPPVLHTFRLRSGENILMKARGTVLEYYDSQNSSWATVRTGLSTNDFDFADFNINTDLVSFTYFGNGVDNFMRWSGAHTNLNGALVGGETTIPVFTTNQMFVVTATDLNGALSGGETTITVDSTSSFPATGIINIAGADYEYSSKTATTFVIQNAFEGTAADETRVTLNTNQVVIAGTIYSYDVLTSTTIHLTSAFVGTAANNASVSQATETFPGNPKGNIYMAAQNRLFIAGIVVSGQAIYFSEYGNANNFLNAQLVTSSTATAPGIFNLAEGGGAVTGMKMDEEALYFWKRSLIYKATLTDSFYSIQTLKPFDGKSQTTGAVGKQAVFAAPNGIFFLAPDQTISLLARIDYVDFPQSIPLSDIIQPTVTDLGFDTAVGISFNDKAYIAVKSSPIIAANDVVLVYNIFQKFWEAPIVGWNVNDWAIYNNGVTEDLYFSDSITNNVYLIDQTSSIDYIYDTSAFWFSKQLAFGAPGEQKVLWDCFIEGYITSNTSLGIAALFDENGYTKTLSTNFLGTEVAFTFSSPIFNLFGINPFGIEVFGGNLDQTGRKKFRIYLDKGLRNYPFYVLQMVFGSSGVGQDWEVTRMGFLISLFSQPIRPTLQRIFS